MTTRMTSHPQPTSTSRAGSPRRVALVVIAILVVAAAVFWAGRASAPLQVEPAVSGTIVAVQHRPEIACVNVGAAAALCGVPYAVPNVSVAVGTKVLLRQLPELGPDQPPSFLLAPGK
ncbi:MAG: hypothetical protein ACXVXY_13445 [Mycobacteriaceae bacterium]